MDCGRFQKDLQMVELLVIEEEKKIEGGAELAGVWICPFLIGYFPVHVL